jgi:hypothetical protein
MLEFAIKYQAAINAMTGDLGTKLRVYELNREEWEVVGQLCKVLKVRSMHCLLCFCLTSCGLKFLDV